MLFNTVYNYNSLHKLSHITSGYILLAIYNYSNTIKFKMISLVVLSAILMYQFGQYFFNIRIFMDVWEIKIGNSLGHTCNKLIDYIIGALLYLVINYGKGVKKEAVKSEE